MAATSGGLESLVFEIPKGTFDKITLRLPALRRNRAEWFYEFCQANDDCRFEQTAEGEILVIAPPGGESGDRETEVSYQLRAWAERDGSGRAFANTGFRLPNGA